MVGMGSSQNTRDSNYYFIHEQGMKAADFNYLIIGGVPKAGTTSLYKYLADHPDVCAATIKETRFFLNKEDSAPSVTRFDGGNLEKYIDYFMQFNNKYGNMVRMEATPDYLYSDSAIRMLEILPLAKIVFILRDPVGRMCSWYQYAKQRGVLDKSVSFDEYVRMQIDQPVTNVTPSHLRALEQCRYSKYLKRFKDRFIDRVLTLSLEDLESNPFQVMERISLLTGLDKMFYKKYTFTVENESNAVRFQLINRVYYKVSLHLDLNFHSQPIIKKILKVPNRWIKAVLKLNRRKCKRVDVSKETAKLIREYSKHK